MATKYNQYIHKDGNWILIGTSQDTLTYSLTQEDNKLILSGSNGSTDEVTLPDVSKLEELPSAEGLKTLLELSTYSSNIVIGDGTNSEFEFTMAAIINGKNGDLPFIATIESVLLFDRNTGEQVFADVIVDHVTNLSRSDILKIKFNSIPELWQYECRVTFRIVSGIEYFYQMN